jgi:hypothetical protein
MSSACIGLGAFGMPKEVDPWQRYLGTGRRPRNYHLPRFERDTEPDAGAAALIHVIVRSPHTRAREALIDALYQWRRKTPERFCGVA